MHRTATNLYIKRILLLFNILFDANLCISCIPKTISPNCMLQIIASSYSGDVAFDGFLIRFCMENQSCRVKTID